MRAMAMPRNALRCAGQPRQAGAARQTSRSERHLQCSAEAGRGPRFSKPRPLPGPLPRDRRRGPTSARRGRVRQAEQRRAARRGHGAITCTRNKGVSTLATEEERQICCVGRIPDTAFFLGSKADSPLLRARVEGEHARGAGISARPGGGLRPTSRRGGAGRGEVPRTRKSHRRAECLESTSTAFYLRRRTAPPWAGRGGQTFPRHWTAARPSRRSSSTRTTGSSKAAHRAAPVDGATAWSTGACNNATST